jgi:hypothetical protein
MSTVTSFNENEDILELENILESELLFDKDEDDNEGIINIYNCYYYYYYYYCHKYTIFIIYYYVLDSRSEYDYIEFANNKRDEIDSEANQNDEELVINYNNNITNFNLIQYSNYIEIIFNNYN